MVLTNVPFDKFGDTHFKMKHNPNAMLKGEIFTAKDIGGKVYYIGNGGTAQIISLYLF